MENSPKSYEDAPREIALEANQLHGKSAPQEEIGRFLVSNETDTAKSKNREAAIDKRVETMSHSELMDISSKIIIEGTSLKKIYETHLVGERGLRRLVGEYLRTGDIMYSLKFELLQHEMDFERDPQLRDRIKREIQAPNGGRPLNTLLQQAGVVEGHEVAGKKEDAAILGTRLLRADSQRAQDFRHRRFLDMAFISIILILLLLVIILIISRR
jgi:hypothetical protein